MSEDEFESKPDLDEYGVLWQVVGFSIVGTVCTMILAIYSGSDALAFRIFETAVVTLYWAFAPVIAYVNDRSRELFKRNSQIRKEAKQEASRRAREEGLKEGRQVGVQEGRQEGRAAESERIRSELAAKGIIIPPEVADSVFNHRNGHEN